MTNGMDRLGRRARSVVTLATIGAVCTFAAPAVSISDLCRRHGQHGHSRGRR
jgi:hypothetical protein